MIIILTILVVYSIFISYYESKVKITKKSYKITKILSYILSLSPIAFAITFTFLLSFALKGRTIERLSHGLVVFSLWINALQFYINLVSRFKDKKSILFSIIGIVISISVAIVLTPLNQYNGLVFIHLNNEALIFSIFVLFIVYISSLITNNILRIKKTNKN